MSKLSNTNYYFKVFSFYTPCPRDLPFFVHLIARDAWAMQSRDCLDYARATTDL